jgi:hypothetical protein
VTALVSGLAFVPTQSRRCTVSAAARISTGPTLVSRLAFVAELSRRLVCKRDWRAHSSAERHCAQQQCDPLHVLSPSVPQFQVRLVPDEVIISNHERDYYDAPSRGAAASA